MTVLSFRPEAENLTFLNEETLGIGKSKIINKALKNYRIYLLRNEMRKGFSNQTKEDLALANSDFNDYINIIDKEGI